MAQGGAAGVDMGRTGRPFLAVVATACGRPCDMDATAIVIVYEQRESGHLLSRLACGQFGPQRRQNGRAAAPLRRQSVIAGFYNCLMQ